MSAQAASIGTLQIGAMPFAVQRVRLDPGPIELGLAVIGTAVLAGPALGASSNDAEGGGAYWRLLAIRRGRR